MPVFEDQLKLKVQLDTYPPKRIVSLVPSITELLFDLGAEDEIVGVTRFCIHPKDKTASLKKIGGTKNVHIEDVIALQPDLIVGCKEENTKADVEALAAWFPVWISDVNTLDDALSLIHGLGDLLGRQDSSRSMVQKTKTNFFGMKRASGVKVAYLIWNNPLMVAANNTFINEMLSAIGFENVYAGRSRYPATTFEELAVLKPDVILLSSEPYPFNDEHVKLFSQSLPGCDIRLVDGTYFSWYGSRLMHSPEYFNSISSSLSHIGKA